MKLGTRKYCPSWYPILSYKQRSKIRFLMNKDNTRHEEIYRKKNRSRQDAKLENLLDAY